MRLFDNRSLVLLGLAAALTAVPAGAADCGCKPRPAHAVDALSQYKAAFAGRVASVQDQGATVLVTLDVARSWKGPRGKQVVLTAPKDACTVAFEPGQDYLVFASGTKEALVTDSCGTSALEAAGNAISQLDMNGGYVGRPLVMPERK